MWFWSMTWMTYTKTQTLIQINTINTACDETWCLSCLWGVCVCVCGVSVWDVFACEGGRGLFGEGWVGGLMQGVF